MKIRLFLFFLISALSLNSYSSELTSGYISRIYPSGNVMRFKLKDDSCNPVNRYYYFYLDSEVSKIWATLIISAATVKNKIHVRVPSCGFAADSAINYIYQDFE